MMNDRFKFRAFDTFAEKMIQNHISICEGELYEWCPDGLHIKHDIGDSAIVMQCTGLRDKHNKLIYEGDIVRGKDHFDRDRKCIVRYSETYCCYFIVGDGWSDEYMFNLNDKEVIGNIYTDAHLLESED